MKSFLLSLIVFGAVYMTAHGQANTKLSNLVPPTAVNADLLPNSNNTRNLGSNTRGWKSIYTTGRYYINGGLFLHNKGTDNTLVGDSVGTAVSNGTSNTGLGDRALFNDTSGSFNTAIGYRALYNNLSAHRSTAIGYQALFTNTINWGNTAVGYNALYSNTGSDNTATGTLTLFSNTSGSANVANGYSALKNSTVGWDNSAVGYYALISNTTGNDNTALGYLALSINTTGSRNTAMGSYVDITTSTLTNATAIGYNAKVDASSKVRIGNTLVTKIGGQVSWSTFSDGRYKQNIKQDVHGLDFINSLKPISYTVDVQSLNAHYNKGRTHLDRTETDANIEDVMKESEEMASKIVYNGFIAQEVEEAAKKLNYEFSGVDKPESKEGLYGIRYSDFVIPLVKAVQELDAKTKQIEELKARIEKLEALLTLGNSNTGGNLSGAYLELIAPNPSRSTTIIRYGLPPGTNSTKIDMVNMKGQVVKTHLLPNQSNGLLTFNTAALAAGSYIYTLWVNGRKAESKQMLITR